ncbi:hypothetical protein [Nocardia brasiliensis]|uniref:hypothetical protein n=1 Tax=Nocardia brasiliensis TaxID=37326 RepID=UPI003D903994
MYSSPNHQVVAERRLIERLNDDEDGRRPTQAEEKAVAAAILAYPEQQREQMAVLDYVMANTDRNWDNYRTGRDNDIVAIDNSLSFPEVPDPHVGIRSDFVYEFRNRELSRETLAAVHAASPDQLRAAWTDAGLSDNAVAGALARLNEIRTHGAITGESWPGLINPADFRGKTKAMPTGWIEY